MLEIPFWEKMYWVCLVVGVIVFIEITSKIFDEVTNDIKTWRENRAKHRREIERTWQVSGGFFQFHP